MALPRPPISPTTPIPNQPFESEEVYYLESNQGHLPLGQGLYIDPLTGQFTNIEPSPYIYCTPQYSNLPVSYPPYNCETAVNTAGVTDFTDAWRSCAFSQMPCVDSSEVTNFQFSWSYTGLTSFPSIDTSKGTDFTYCWGYCYYLAGFPKLNFESGEVFTSAWVSCPSLTEFPELDLSNGTEFIYTWGNCTGLTSFPDIDLSGGLDFGFAWSGCSYLTSFPSLNMSNGLNFSAAWYDCSSLVSFPQIAFNPGANFSPFYDDDYGGTWENCISLVDFPPHMFDNSSETNFSRAWVNCALSQQSVDNILVSLDTAGQSNGVVDIWGGHPLIRGLMVLQRRLRWRARAGL